MVTIDQIVGYIQQIIAEDRLTGNTEGLRRTQLAAGVLMAAAKAAGDRETTQRFQILAAQAANKQEELEGE